MSKEKEALELIEMTINNNDVLTEVFNLVSKICEEFEDIYLDPKNSLEDKEYIH